MIQLLLQKISRVVNFKKSVSIGDLVITNCKDHLLYAIVHDIRSSKSKKESGEWWDIDLYVLTFPPIKRTMTLSTKQMAGHERWEANGFEQIFVPIDLDAVDQKKPPLSLVKV